MESVKTGAEQALGDVHLRFLAGQLLGRTDSPLRGKGIPHHLIPAPKRMLIHMYIYTRCHAACLQDFLDGLGIINTALGKILASFDGNGTSGLDEPARECPMTKLCRFCG